jgi:hypothetical protein
VASKESIAWVFHSGTRRAKINWATGGVPLTDSKLRALTER